MKVFPLDRSGDLMTVTAKVWGAHEARELLLVIDTGAAATTIEPAILEGLGYSSRDAILQTRVPTPAGIQHGQLFRVARFHALGAELSSFVVQSLALNDEYGIDGLLGMNFLENYNFTIRPRDRQIRLEPVESASCPGRTGRKNGGCRPRRTAETNSSSRCAMHLQSVAARLAPVEQDQNDRRTVVTDGTLHSMSRNTRRRPGSVADPATVCRSRQDRADAETHAVHPSMHRRAATSRIVDGARVACVVLDARSNKEQPP